ncbi:MAG: 1-acyl-sn-glycerol-3-phosphate acyltransferase [Acidobacteria bacterium]|nr:1-acyl-sn-glycerol-3-phosphate acyltransferase [Acidobacteriota bacterium]
MPPGKWLRTYIITPPFSAFCFAMFWLTGVLIHPFDRTRRMAHHVARFWSHLLLRTAGIRIHTEGLDHISPPACYVLVSNHLSLADTPLMCAYLPGLFRFMAKESLMKVPLIGGHLRRGGHISVARDDARSAVRSLAVAAKLIEAGEGSVLIFAEGGRSEGEIRAFKGGAAHLAIKSHVPVVPMAIAGTGEVMPKGAKLLRPGAIALIAGEPVDTRGMTPADRDSLTTVLQDRVAALSQRAATVIGRG